MLKRAILAILAVFLTCAPAAAASLMTVAEFGASPTAVGSFFPQIAPFPPITTQQIDYTAGVTQTAALNAATSYVCVNVNVRAAIKVQTGAASATTTDWPMAVDVPWCFSVPRGQSYKISVIANP